MSKDILTHGKRIVSGIVAKQIIEEARRNGKRPPPFAGTRALVERQSWKKVVWLFAKCFLLRVHALRKRILH